MDKIDEELGQLERDIRTLKIEYEQYFGGGRSRPPNDTVWRIEQMVKRYSERGADMSYGQRFRYNNLAQTYAKYQDIFRKRIKAKEEGTVQRHYGAAARAIEQERARTSPAEHAPHPAEPAVAAVASASSGRPAGPRRTASELVSEPGGYVVHCSDPDRERDKVHDLYTVLLEAKKSAGEKTEALTLENFTSFVRQKTAQLKQQAKCNEVEYAVQVENGQIKLKARVKT